MSNVAYVRNQGGSILFMTDETVGMCIHPGGGFVGINTMMPTTNLHVEGSAFVSGTLTATKLVVEGGSVTGLADSATTDTTVASNITRGQLLPSVIPATGVTAGSYGFFDTIAAFAVGADGRLSSAYPCPIRLETSNVRGLAPSATIDTTHASNITTGTLSAARIPDTGVLAAFYPAGEGADAFPQVTIQADGRVTQAATVPITVQTGQVGGLQPWATTGFNQPPVLYGLHVAQNETLASGQPALTLAGGVTISGGLSVQGTLVAHSNATFTAPVAFNGGVTLDRLTVFGYNSVSAGSLTGPMQVSSNATFTGAVGMAGGATLSNLTVNGSATLSDQLSVRNVVGPVVVQSNASFTCPVVITSSNATLTSMTVTQATVVASVCVTDRFLSPLHVSSNASFGSVFMSNASVTDMAILNGGTVFGDLSVGNIVNPVIVSCNATFTAPLNMNRMTVSSNATFSASIQATSGLTTLSSLTVTQSTLLGNTSNTGSLFVGGGLHVQGSGSVAQLSGGVSAPSLAGGCITDSTTTTSSQVAASATAVQGVATIASAALARSGGTMTGPLFAPNLSSCNVVAAALSGGAITDSWTMTSSQVAASATVVSNVAAYVTATTPGGLPLTGGIMTGPLTVQGLLTASNVQIMGNSTTMNSIEILTSNLWVSNVGTGPALSVSQVEGGALGAQPVATFYSGQSLALLLDGSGNVALSKPSVTPGATLDISGNVVVSGTVTVPTVIGNATGLMGAPSISVGAVTASGTTRLLGAVGVGKGASIFALDVSGSIVVSGQASFASNLSVAGQLTTSNASLLGTTMQALAYKGSLIVPSSGGSVGVGTTAWMWIGGGIGMGATVGIGTGFNVYRFPPIPPIIVTNTVPTYYSGTVSGQVYGNGTYIVTSSSINSGYNNVFYLFNSGFQFSPAAGLYSSGGTQSGVYSGQYLIVADKSTEGSGVYNTAYTNCENLVSNGYSDWHLPDYNMYPVMQTARLNPTWPSSQTYNVSGTSLRNYWINQGYPIYYPTLVTTYIFATGLYDSGYANSNFSYRAIRLQSFV